MEAKLREYRALRRRKELLENAKEKLQNTTNKVVDLIVPKFFRDMDKEKNEDEKLLLEDEELPATADRLEHIEEEEPEEEECESIVEESQETWRYFTIKWTVYTIIWLTLYIFFLKVGFGAVFFVISLLIAICLNTRTGRRKKGEVSAYSVFNKNCASIEGTLKAEELEKQFLYGAGGIRMF